MQTYDWLQSDDNAFGIQVDEDFPEKVPSRQQHSSPEDAPARILHVPQADDTTPQQLSGVTQLAWTPQSNTTKGVAKKDPKKGAAAKPRLGRSYTTLRPQRLLPLLKEEDLRQCSGIAGDEDDDDDDGQDHESTFNYDDGFKALSAEDYFTYRAELMRGRLEKKARWYSRRHIFYQILIFLCTLGSAVLSLFGLTNWMPLTVALYSVLRGTIDYLQIPLQLQKTNTALSTIQNQTIWWQSLTMLAKRTTDVKEHLVTTVENAINQEHASYIDMTRGAKTTKKDAQDPNKASEKFA
jgi:hypothetical protein